MSERPRILIAGGGTGGHVFSGLAVAERLREMADVDVTFVGTARGLEVRAVPARGYDLELLEVEPMKGGGPTRALRGGAVAGVATFKALSLLRRTKPRAVLSVGGYAAGPVSLAAATLGISVAILEPNRVMGLANKLLAPLAKRTYLAFVDQDKKLPLPVRASSVRIFGIPIREGFQPSIYRPRGAQHVLVLGGSQGAAALNERVPDAIGRLVSAFPTMSVLHQAGRDRESDVREAYARERVSNAKVVAFIDDMAAEIARADVVIARAGAGTLAEIAAIGRAAILVPFPFAADDHQAKNAKALADVGGCIAIRQEAADGVRMATELRILFENEEAIMKMADASRAFGKPQAAQDIACDLLRLARVHFEAQVESRRQVRPPQDSGDYTRQEAE